MIYIAGAIDKSNVEDSKGWFKRAGEAFAPYPSYNPMAAYHGIDLELVSKEDCEDVVQINKAALYQSKVIVAKMCDSPSVGVPIELYMAHDFGIPVFVVYDKTPGVYLKYLAKEIFKSEQECFNSVFAFLNKKYKEEERVDE